MFKWASFITIVASCAGFLSNELNEHEKRLAAMMANPVQELNIVYVSDKPRILHCRRKTPTCSRLLDK